MACLDTSIAAQFEENKAPRGPDGATTKKPRLAPGL
jgi:hypothetical protein